MQNAWPTAEYSAVPSEIQERRRAIASPHLRTGSRIPPLRLPDDHADVTPRRMDSELQTNLSALETRRSSSARRKTKKRRLGSVSGRICRRRAERINHVWSIDFIFDRTINGRSVKILSLIDEYSRECIALEVSRRFTGDDLVALLVDVFAIRGIPAFIRSDNGPEFISRRVRDFLGRIDVGTSFIEPGSPWENGYVESFHSRFRDEFLSCEAFSTLAEAQQVIGQWRSTYNHRRPHSSLSGLTPAEFATRCAASTPVAALLTSKRHNECDSVTQSLPS